MNIRRFSITALTIAAVACTVPALSSCGHSKQADSTSDSTKTAMGKPGKGGIKLGAPGGGPVIDKSADSTLQAMIKSVVPKFKQFEYTDSMTGKTMTYNLYIPAGADGSKNLPLVLFMADASTPGTDPTRPLTQGYGALVWATDKAQAKNPCFVLVPQFTGVAVNDAYQHTDEVHQVLRILDYVADNYNVDRSRLYTTGQSMGGMISMYYNVAYPDIFAASIFVDCHWDTSTFDDLARHKFVYFIAGDSGKAYQDLKPLEQAAEKDGVAYTFSEWSAKLPIERQDSLAATMLEKGAPVNFFMFEPKSVLPDNGQGSEHMYSFDYAYRNSAVRDWLFRQRK